MSVLERVCRLCLCRNAKKLELLFDPIYSDLQYLAKIMTGLDLQNKNYSTKICSNCVKRLELIDEFRKQCLDANKYFRKHHRDELERVCRLCLCRNAKKLKLLFDPIYSDLQYLAKIMTALDLQDKNYSTKICSNCVKRLELINEFRKQCLDANKYFRKHHRDEFTVETEYKNIFKGEDTSLVLENIEIVEFQTNLANVTTTKNMSLTENTDYLYQINEHVGISNNDKNLTSMKMEMIDQENAQISTKSKSKGTTYRDRMGEFVCEICGNKYNTNEYLKIHKNAKHNPDFKKFKCDICAKEFDFTQSLRMHMVYHRDPTLQCEICKKKFYVKKELNEHVFIHTNTRNYKCEICSKAFRTQQNRRVHIRGVHSHVRPFQCDVGDCVKAFSENYLLNFHKRKSHQNK